MWPTTAIGLDIGGTKIACGVIAADGRILERSTVATPNTDEGAAVIGVMTELIDELRLRYPEVQAIGVGAAGLIESSAGRIRWAPNNAYRNLDVGRLLGAATGLPVTVDNDANAAAWAERTFGAGAGCRNLLLITVGTGIGGGLVLNGELYRGEYGLSGEIGHITVDPNGPTCGCGNIGCLEAMASGTALGRRGRETAMTDQAGALAMLAGAPERVTGEVVFQAARQGDPVSCKLFEEIGFWLGIGIAGLVATVDPGLVVIAGGLISAGDLLLEPTNAAFQRYVFAAERRNLPRIVPARLGPEAGLVGAAALAMHSLVSESITRVG